MNRDKKAAMEKFMATITAEYQEMIREGNTHNDRFIQLQTILWDEAAIQDDKAIPRCAITWCDEPLRSRGLCNKHYQKWTRLRDEIDTPERFVNVMNKWDGCPTCGLQTEEATPLMTGNSFVIVCVHCARLAGIIAQHPAHAWLLTESQWMRFRTHVSVLARHRSSGQ